MKTQASILIIPGLRDHVEEHWQTLLQTKLSRTRKVYSVPPLTSDKLSCTARVNAIEQTLRGIEEPVMAVAHSGGVLMLVHWAQKYRGKILAALLATPADLESALPAGYPTTQVLQSNGWLPIPRARLAFPSLVVASSNDPLASLQRVEQMARDWGSKLVNVGAVGHLNPASGFGDWPRAEDLIQQMETEFAAASGQLA